VVCLSPPTETVCHCAVGLLAVGGGCWTVGHFESLAEVCAEVPRRFELESGTV
jgi:hypothetical protein